MAIFLYKLLSYLDALDGVFISADDVTVEPSGYEIAYTTDYAPDPRDTEISDLKDRLDKLESHKYSDIIGDRDIDAIKFPLYHGLRFNPIDKLESIFKSGFIYPGKRVPTSFESMDGTTHTLPGYYEDEENCSNNACGSYVTVSRSMWKQQRSGCYRVRRHSCNY